MVPRAVFANAVLAWRDGASRKGKCSSFSTSKLIFNLNHCLGFKVQHTKQLSFVIPIKRKKAVIRARPWTRVGLLGLKAWGDWSFFVPASSGPAQQPLAPFICSYWVASPSYDWRLKPWSTGSWLWVTSQVRSFILLRTGHSCGWALWQSILSVHRGGDSHVGALPLLPGRCRTWLHTQLTTQDQEGCSQDSLAHTLPHMHTFWVLKL